MKQKLCAALAAAVLMVLWAAEAFAAAPLTFREIVEQVAVPLAVANDPEVGINNMYSAEELAEIVGVLRENGIELEETDYVMQMARNGLGLYEETVISQVCEQALGKTSAGWSLEDQDWFNEQLTKIGSYETHISCLPGPDNMTYKEAEAAALGFVKAAHGEDLALENRSVWKQTCSFFPASEAEPEDSWSFRWIPQDIFHGTYSVSFADRNPAGTWEISAEVPDWTQPYSGEQVMDWFNRVYGGMQNEWPQAVWQELHEMMQAALLNPREFEYPEYRGLQLAAYPEPGERDISREEAIQIARNALGKDRAALDSAVLAEYAGVRSWLVRLVIWSPWDRSEDPEAGSWVFAVDSETGAVRTEESPAWYAAWVPEAAFEKAENEQPEAPDYLQIAVDSVREKYPGLDPLDEAEYRVSDMGLYTHYIDFITTNIRHGNISVIISESGEVREVTADEEGPSCDNLFDRYWKIHGYFGQWGQDIWVQLEKDKAGLKAKSIDGKVLKATHYPEESSVKIGHEEAQQLGMKAAGKRRVEVNTCVLVDAKPHPVWIMRILGDHDIVIGIDAESGKTVFTEQYIVDETPHYVLYSLPKTWRKLKKK